MNSEGPPPLTLCFGQKIRSKCCVLEQKYQREAFGAAFSAQRCSFCVVFPSNGSHFGVWEALGSSTSPILRVWDAWEAQIYVFAVSGKPWGAQLFISMYICIYTCGGGISMLCVCAGFGCRSRAQGSTRRRCLFLLASCTLVSRVLGPQDLMLHSSHAHRALRISGSHASAFSSALTHARKICACPRELTLSSCQSFEPA